MAANPNTNHQSASTWIHHYLVVFVLVAQKGRVFHAPYDVRLRSGATIQPDVIVVLNSNLNIIQAEKISGSPDLVVEVSSPGTKYYDRNKKKQTYEQNGIKEYWIVDPDTQEVEVFELHNSAYVSLGVFRGKNTLPTKVIPNFPVRVEQFFV
jgi:Uma2 family endonuclease